MGNQFGWGRFYFPLDYTSPTQLVRTVQVPRLDLPRLDLPRLDLPRLARARGPRVQSARWRVRTVRLSGRPCQEAEWWVPCVLCASAAPTWSRSLRSP